MSKKNKDGDKKDEVPIDYQTESKMLNFTILQKQKNIDNISNASLDRKNLLIEKNERIKLLLEANSRNMKNEKELDELQGKYAELDQEHSSLKRKYDGLKEKMEKEKADAIQMYLDKIKLLEKTIKDNDEKVSKSDEYKHEKERLELELQKKEKEIKEMEQKQRDALETMEINNRKKFSELKEKMKLSIQATEAKVKELNSQNMDVSTKLILLQNHQLLIQLEYQSQQIEELTQKAEYYENKFKEIQRDLEIHKEVEISLAEKNKKLKKENDKIKGQLDNDNGKDSENEKNDESAEKNKKPKKLDNSNDSDNEKNNESIDNSKSMGLGNYANMSNLEKKIFNLEKKIINLEKKLKMKNKDYTNLKRNSKYIELRLKNYEQKYAGLFKFFEEALQNFYEDEEIKNNKEIYINIDSIKSGDFSSFSNEEKFSILVILMKYLIPLLNSNDINNSVMGNINLKYHYNNNMNSASVNSSMGSSIIRRHMDDSEIRKIVHSKGNYKISSNSYSLNSSTELPRIQISKNFQ